MSKQHRGRLGTAGNTGPVQDNAEAKSALPAPSASAPDGEQMPETTPFPSPDYERGYRDGYNNGLAETAACKAPAAGEWQTVQTAPENKNILVGWYNQFGEWICFVAQLRAGLWLAQGHQLAVPTHWMPIPLDPSASPSPGKGRGWPSEEQLAWIIKEACDGVAETGGYCSYGMGVAAAQAVLSAALAARPAPAAGEWQTDAAKFAGDLQYWATHEALDPANRAFDLNEAAKFLTRLASSPSPGEGWEWPSEDELTRRIFENEACREVRCQQTSQDNGVCGCMLDARRSAKAALRAAAPVKGQPSEADMRAFGAADAACYKWPGDTDHDKALRAAYIEGAADCGAAPVKGPAPSDDLKRGFDQGYDQAIQDGAAGQAPQGMPMAYAEGVRDGIEEGYRLAPQDVREALADCIRDLEQTYCHVSSVTADRISITLPKARAALFAPVRDAGEEK